MFQAGPTKVKATLFYSIKVPFEVENKEHLIDFVITLHNCMEAM